jgi:hypothetical protein
MLSPENQMRGLKAQVLSLRRENESKDRELREGRLREKAYAREADKLRQMNNRLRMTIRDYGNGASVGVGYESNQVRRLKDQVREIQVRMGDALALSKRKDARIEDLELSNELLREANEQAEDCVAEEWDRLMEQKEALKQAPLVPDTPESSAAPPAHGPFDSPLSVAEMGEMNDDSLFVINCLATQVASSEKTNGELHARASRAERSRDAVCMAVLDALNREKAKVVALQTLLMDRHTHASGFHGIIGQ